MPATYRFRDQLTESDCFPTSVLNALGLLFERDVIPPAVVQRVYLYTLDGIGARESAGRWTSDEAGEFLANWLSAYATKQFAVEATCLTGRDVHLGPNNPITRTLSAGGTAVVDMLTARGYTHSVLLLMLDAHWVYLWDPYHRSVPRTAPKGAVQTVQDHSSGANFRIRRSYFDRSRSQTFGLGPTADRSCLLLTAKRGKRKRADAA